MLAYNQKLDIYKLKSKVRCQMQQHWWNSSTLDSLQGCSMRLSGARRSRDQISKEDLSKLPCSTPTTMMCLLLTPLLSEKRSWGQTTSLPNTLWATALQGDLTQSASNSDRVASKPRGRRGVTPKNTKTIWKRFRCWFWQKEKSLSLTHFKLQRVMSRMV